MPRTKLTLSKETLAELTADEMSSVVGAGDTDSCSCIHIGLCVGVRQQITPVYIEFTTRCPD